MKRFILGLFLFSIPVVLLFLPPFIIFGKAGEFSSINEILKKQNLDKSSIVGMAYSSPEKELKTQAVLIKNPEVIALGTSRVMQFRSDFFKNNVSFYNAGGTIGDIADFESFLNAIPPGKTPRIIIMGLDQHFFSPISTHVSRWNVQSHDFSPYKDFLTYGWKQFYIDFFKGKLNYKNFASNEYKDEFIGLEALINKNGFRNDGSYFYGQFLDNPKASDEMLENMRSFIANIVPGTPNLEYGPEFSITSFESLDKFLNKARDRNIYVIGFLPPYSSVLREKIIRMGNRFTKSMQTLPVLLNDKFNKYGFGFYDFSDISLIPSSDRELIDIVHGSEKMYARIILHISNHDSQIGNLIDETLGEKIDTAKSNLEIFK